MIQTKAITRVNLLTLHNRRFSNIPGESTVVQYSSHGNPKEVIKLSKHILPSLGTKQVLIKFLYAPINPADINMIQGSYAILPPLPAVGGSEGVGEVVETGDSNKFKVGDFVLPSRPGLGTWRDYGVFHESDFFAVPNIQGIDKEHLATLSVNPATALRMLDDFVTLKEGDTIIQNGSNSMVGTSLIQIAHARGIKTINIIRAREPSKFEELVRHLKECGADYVVADNNIRSSEFRDLISNIPKPKLALNCVGGETSTEMARLLEKGGTMVTYGGMSLKPITIPTSLFIFKDITLKGFWMSRWYDSHGEKGKLELINELMKLVQQKKLKVWTENYELNNFENAIHSALNTMERNYKKVLLQCNF